MTCIRKQRYYLFQAVHLLIQIPYPVILSLKMASSLLLQTSVLAGSWAKAKRSSSFILDVFSLDISRLALASSY